MRGWVAAHAPAFGTMTDREKEESANRLVNWLQRTGHRTTLTRLEVTRLMTAAANRWAGTVNRARSKMTDRTTEEVNQDPDQPTAHPTAVSGTESGTTQYPPSNTSTVATDTNTVADEWSPARTTVEEYTLPTAGASTPSVVSVTSPVDTPCCSASPRTACRDSARPSGRPTALPDRSTIPSSAPTCRASSSAPRPRTRSHRPPRRSAVASAARPPP